MGIRVGIYLTGLSINALGIALIIFSAAGAGAWDTIAIGLNEQIGLTIGICTIIIQALVVFTTASIEKARPQYGSIIAIVIRSIFLDAWIYLVFQRMEIPSSWEMQWLWFISGIIAMGIGIGMYVEAQFPKSPIDGLMLAIHHRFHWSINTSRIVVELSGVLFGVLLGGPVGFGTLIIALFVGKIIQFSNIRVKRMFNKENMNVSHSKSL